jgi:F0F1-type ATP synthase assembly protein I
MADEKQGRNQNPAVIWARYSQIAFIIPAAVVVGLLLGKLLDYWFRTHWFFLVGLIIGAVAGLTDVIRTVIKQTK